MTDSCRARGSLHLPLQAPGHKSLMAVDVLPTYLRQQDPARSPISSMKVKRPPTPEFSKWSLRPSTPPRGFLSHPAQATPGHLHQLLKSPFFWLQAKGKKSSSMQDGEEDRRFLITVYVVGSPGPLRMVVGGRDSVGDVIQWALKLYTREGRLPAVGSDPAGFELHCANSGLGAMDVKEQLLSCGSRSLLLCKKANAACTTRMEKSKSWGGKLCKLKTITSRRLGVLCPFARSISFNH